MQKKIARRGFVKTCMLVPILPVKRFSENELHAVMESNKKKSHLKMSLNAYSFNDPLKAKTFSLDDLLVYCAEQDFEGVDITGYYFPNYPQVPTDEFIFLIKRKAHLLGLSISGTGIKNDFTQADPIKRKADIALVKNWIDVAAKLGAPVIRIFSGVEIPKQYSWKQIAEWMAKDIQECVDYGQTKGVIVAIQNHNDFLKNAGQVNQLFKMVNRPWFGLVLDIGSYQEGNPYEQIKDTSPLAVNWQLKENMFEDGKEIKTDLKKVLQIILDSGYRGFVPIETLGKGDPKEKVALFLKEIRTVLNELI
jgi:sugar phosphate isomerase/epimerase